ncbi:acid protease [Obba rivulosa]|uniref:Acid protease n=1 Tax=Obba rivulosa TaxID=1052685 RepID=A0A8E2DRQ8_9APHY|nr:acid protease [Obba rivulosa]
MSLLELKRPAMYPPGKGPSFQAAYARAARRYGFEPGKYAGYAKRNNVVVKVKSKDDKATEHEVPAHTEYVVPVTIGTPGVTLNLDFDTGSSDLWVWSSELAGEGKRESKAHAIYDPSKSSTAKKTEGTWNISYGDGSSASGNVYTDNVTVAGITIKGQAVELAKNLSSSFLSDGGNDGLLGLAWPAINTVQPQPVATPVENMMKQKLVDPQVFTVKLGHGDEASFYSFGFIDKTVTSQPISYASVDNSQGFWQVPSTSWTINGEEQNREGNTTILDTGTTLCLVDDSVVEAIYQAIEGARYDNSQGGWKYPSNAQIPTVTFAVGDTQFTVNEKDFGFGDAGNGFTFGGIQSRGDNPFDIFGDVFLKSVYVVFDQGETRVGLAQRED